MKGRPTEEEKSKDSFIQIRVTGFKKAKLKRMYKNVSKATNELWDKEIKEYDSAQIS